MHSAPTRRRGSYLVCVLLVWLLPHSHLKGQSSSETVWIPMQEKGLFSSQQIQLEAALYKPPGDGPFPIVIFNHGSTGPGVIPAERTLNPRGYGSYLLEKEIALLIPMRRGRGKSEGAYRESYKCHLHQSRQGIRYAMESLDAAHEWLTKQPWADVTKLILSGSSRGGILSVVYAAERPGSAIGVVNFVGGWMSDTCVQYTYTDINAALFKEAGAKSKVPNLFLYAENDSYYSAASISSYVQAFLGEGGKVEHKLFDLGAGANGHGLFWRHSTTWVPYVDRFLLKLGVWQP